MKCPVCSEESFSEWGRVGFYQILKCKSCGLGITSPFPSEEELIEINREIYQVDQRAETYLKRQDYFEQRYRQNLKNIKKYKQKGRLLDIGCNIGLFLKVGREEGFDVTGVELNEECAQYGRKNFNLEIHTDYLEQIALPENSFDVITLYDVLEHIPDMNNFMKEVKRILKPHGLLVLQLPNFDSLMAKLTKSNWNWLTPPDHLYHFTPASVDNYFKINGFTIKDMSSWEPADEFCNNILSSYKTKSKFGKVLVKINSKTKLMFLLVRLMQKRWWLKGKGGLLEVYALNANKEK